VNFLGKKAAEGLAVAGAGSLVQTRCSVWCDQKSDYRPPYLDDEPVRLTLSVDL